MAEDIRHTTGMKELYALRKETIERVFADAKEKHAMRYTLYKGLSQNKKWVRLKFAAMNLWNDLHSSLVAFWSPLFSPLYFLSASFYPCFHQESRNFFDRLKELYNNSLLFSGHYESNNNKVISREYYKIHLPPERT